MADRQLEHVMAQVAAITASLKTLAGQAPDLHAVAYERTVTGNEPVDGQPWPPPGVEHHGNEHARELWHRLEHALRPMETSVRALEWAVGNLLSAGDTPEDIRGWREQIQRREFRDALHQQKLRAERGEYVPTRMVDQPDYPGTSTR